MAPRRVIEQARSYIDAAIELQRRDGRVPQVTDEAYERAVRSASLAFEELRAARRRDDEIAPE